MAGLPTPGADNGVWDDKLNEFLLVEHDTDGTLLDVARPAELAAVSDVADAAASAASGAASDLAEHVAEETTFHGLVAADIVTDDRGVALGDLAVFDGTAWGRLARGADGSVLTSDDAAPLRLSFKTPSAADLEAVANKVSSVWLDDFAGANDSARLAAAVALTGTDTYPRKIVGSNKAYTFTQNAIQPHHGMQLEFPKGVGAVEQNHTPSLQNLSWSLSEQGWFHHATGTELWCVRIAHVMLKGGSGTRLLTSAGSSSIWWKLTLDSICAQQMRSLLGSQTTALYIDGANFTGDWNLNGFYNGCMKLTGADAKLWLDGQCFIDANAAYNTSGGATGQYHLWLANVAKVDLGAGMYMTIQGPWNGVRVTGSNVDAGVGSNIGGPIVFHGGVYEGRNAGVPCYGSLIRVEGGIVKLLGTQLHFAMSSPASSGHSPQDAGVVHQTQGRVLMDGVSYDRATGVGVAVPLGYCNGGEMIVRSIVREWKGGTWGAELPRIDQAGSGTVKADDTVTVI